MELLEPKDWDAVLNTKVDEVSETLEVDPEHVREGYTPRNDQESAERAAELLKKKKGQA